MKNYSIVKRIIFILITIVLINTNFMLCDLIKSFIEFEDNNKNILIFHKFDNVNIDDAFSQVSIKPKGITEINYNLAYLPDKDQNIETKIINKDYYNNTNIKIIEGVNINNYKPKTLNNIEVLIDGYMDYNIGDIIEIQYYDSDNLKLSLNVKVVGKFDLESYKSYEHTLSGILLMPDITDLIDTDYVFYNDINLYYMFFNDKELNNIELIKEEYATLGYLYINDLELRLEEKKNLIYNILLIILIYIALFFLIIYYNYKFIKYSVKDIELNDIKKELYKIIFTDIILILLYLVLTILDISLIIAFILTAFFMIISLLQINFTYRSTTND